MLAASSPRLCEGRIKTGQFRGQAPASGMHISTGSSSLFCLRHPSKWWRNLAAIMAQFETAINTPTPVGWHPLQIPDYGNAAVVSVMDVPRRPMPLGVPGGHPVMLSRMPLFYRCRAVSAANWRFNPSIPGYCRSF